MDRWQGKVAVVTGASAGIGAGLVRDLSENGLTVVGIARRKERIEDLAEQLKNEKGKVYAVKADITKEEEVVAAFEWIKKNVGGIDILINNAGITIKTKIVDGELNLWRHMYELNVLAMCTTVRETLKSLKERGLDEGHIINVNSISGHRLTPIIANMVYSSTKFAAKMLTEGLRLELAAAKSKIRVTNLSPGLVETEIFEAGGWSDLSHFEGCNRLQPLDIAAAAIYALSTPPGVQIAEIMVRPTGEGI